MNPGKKNKKAGTWQAVGALVAHYRRRARLTQEQLAERANISVDTVGSIEQGRLALQPDRAEQFDDLLETGDALAVLSYSGSEGGNCLEVAAHTAAVHIRDSKAAPVGPVLTIAPAAWTAFLGSTREA